MRMLRVIEFLSLDGVMQAPGAPGEDTEGGFQHGGWQRPYFDDVLGATAAEGMAATDTYLFGRKTYEGMAAYWPTAPGDDPYARHLNGTPKYPLVVRGAVPGVRAWFPIPLSIRACGFPAHGLPMIFLAWRRDPGIADGAHQPV